MYYILIRGHSEPTDNAPVTVLAELLPLSITDVQTDQAGNSSYVTTTISGAQFAPNAIVKLVMAGFAEYQPVTTDFVSSTEIIAEFNLAGTPYGSYDVQVINPDGRQAIAPYRLEVEQTVSPDVTIGVGGPRFILAGDTGTYSVALENLGNVNAPYVEFNVGIPQLTNATPSDPSNPLVAQPINTNLYNLPYVEVNTNLSGAPPDAALSADVPFATLQSQVDTAASNGHIQMPGYLFNEAAGGFTGFTFDVTTYPGLAALNDRAFDNLKAELYAAFPQYAKEGILDDGPQGLDLISPGLYEFYELFGQIPDIFHVPFVPFQFDINASATTLTRAEFVAQATQQADVLRTSILADRTAPTALQNLAADQATWENLYLAGLEQAGVLLPDGATPPIGQDPLIMSVMATLATGLLEGPAGSGIISGGNIAQFFSELLTWYGNNPDQTAPVSYYNDHDNPVAVLPTASQYDLGALSPTNFEDFNVYVPWVSWDQRANLPPSFQITSVQEVNGQPVIPLDLSQYVNNAGQDTGLASMTGPFTAEDNGYIPAGQALPFTVNFQNDPSATTTPGEIRITTQLDPSLDPRTFRLGDIQIGDIDIHIPSGMGLFQGDFDFTQTKGFILRVSAGVDLQTGTATWLLQAIDPLSGLVITDPSKGLLPPNNAEGAGAGFVTYTIQPLQGVATGTTMTATATVLFNNVAPQDTAPLTYTFDTVAPTTKLTVSQVGNNPNYQLQWSSADDAGGSGVKSVTLYVSEDGGTYQVWQSQVTQASGTMIYQGQAGHTYSFLALATDVAGNQEQPPAGINAQQSPDAVNLGATPTVPSTTPPNFGDAPAPTVQPSTNPLFTQAQQGIPNAPPASNPSEFRTVLRPFQAQSFATGFDQSDGILGPMALVQAPDGGFLVSGGQYRNELFRIPKNGGPAGSPLVTLPDQIFAMAFDGQGRLWAATGGGPLLQLDPTTGAIVNQFGTGITLALAVNPQTGQIFVSTGDGVEIFDPTTDTFTQYSRDQNLRVSSLAFDTSGNLWAVTWPDASQVVEFDAHARAQVKLTFDSEIQSISFGAQGTPLANLLFVSHDAAPGTAPGTVAPTPSEMTMVNVTTLQQVAVAQGGTRGFAVLATGDGRVLISQSHEVDLLLPIQAPNVVASNPPAGATVSLPLGTVSITFDHDMFQGSATDIRSVLDPANYQLVPDAARADRHHRRHLQPVKPHRYPLLQCHRRGWLHPARQDDRREHRRTGACAGLLQPFPGHQRHLLAGHAGFHQRPGQCGRQDLHLQPDDHQRRPDATPGPLLFDIRRAAAPRRPGPRRHRAECPGLVVAQCRRRHPRRAAQCRPVLERIGRHVLRPVALEDVLQDRPARGPRTNASPVIDAAPSSTATAGQVYQSPIKAHDPNGYTLGYVLISGPAGLSVNPTTGLVTWTPQSTSPASAPVLIDVYDSHGSFTPIQYTIQVAGGSHAPVIAPLPSQVSGQEGQPIVLTVSATDPDGRPLVYWADHLPGGAVVRPVHAFATLGAGLRPGRHV